MGYETLDFEVRDGVGHLTLNRPNAANAIDLTMARELVAVAECCESEGARAILVTGAGKMFCAGGDLAAFGSSDDLPKLIHELADTLHKALARFARMDAPIIAAVNGAAAGAGMSLACMTDLAIAAESAKFTMAYTAAGLAPDGSSSYFLPRIVGVRRAKELMLTNRRLSAQEALEWNLVNRVVPDAELAAESEKLAQSLASGPTRSYGMVKKLIVASANAELETQLDAETDAITAMTETADGREGIAAFLEKRRPAFTGS